MEFLNRLKEPSSWAAVGALATAVGINMDPGLLQGITFLGAGLACLAGFFLKEKAK